MNDILDIKTSSEDTEDFKFWVYLWIYQLKNEAFFVRKSFLWQWESTMTTMLLFWNCTVPCFFGRSEVQSQKSQEIFSLFICLRLLWHIHMGSNTPILKHKELNVFSTSLKILAVACNSSLASKKSKKSN